MRSVGGEREFDRSSEHMRAELELLHGSERSRFGPQVQQRVIGSAPLEPRVNLWVLHADGFQRLPPG